MCILVMISDQYICGVFNVFLKGVRYVLCVVDDIIGLMGDVMMFNGYYFYIEKVYFIKYYFIIIFNLLLFFSFYRFIDKGFGILIFILLIVCVVVFLFDRYFNKSVMFEEIL